MTPCSPRGASLSGAEAAAGGPAAPTRPHATSSNGPIISPSFASARKDANTIASRHRQASRELAAARPVRDNACGSIVQHVCILYQPSFPEGDRAMPDYPPEAHRLHDALRARKGVREATVTA